MAQMSGPLAIVVLISGSGSNLQAIIDAVKSGRVRATIKAVISNRADAYGLERAKMAGIPTRLLEHRDFPDRPAYDRALQQLIDSFDPGLVVLAGFMRILTAGLVEHYSGRLLNIHPSLLPALKGLHTHQRALDAGATEHGASVHFVSPELDAGPVIVQARVPVLENDDADSLATRVLEQEHVIYPKAIELFAGGRLALHDSRVLLDGRPLTSPLVDEQTGAPLNCSE